MITLSSAENALKEVYLGVLANQINMKTHPLFGEIKRSSRNIIGKEVRFAAPAGINGGIMAGTETGDLPESSERPYVSFVAPLKNLYGRMEISDKAVRCSSSDVNSFVNLLQDGMDSLLQASVYNLSRMLFGYGSGKVARVIEIKGDSAKMSATGGIAPGLVVDIYNGDVLKVEKVMVKNVDHANRLVTFSKTATEMGLVVNDGVFVHGSKGNEITGLKGIMANETIYGLKRSDYSFLQPYKLLTTNGAFDEAFVQSIIDIVENTGTEVNFITTCYEAKRVYQQYLTLYKKNVEFATLKNGSKYIAHVGVPIVPSNFIEEGEAFFLNTDNLTFYELGDWKWLEDEAGRILKQHPSKPTYSATLVKYTELVCNKIDGMAYIGGLSSTVSE